MLAHVHVMKTAGQTVREILRQSLGYQHCDLRVAGQWATAADVQWAMRIHPSLKSIAGHHVPLHETLAIGRPLQYFTFLRDPVARCISHYQFSRQNGSWQASFDEFVTRYANYQTLHLSNTNSALRAIELLEERRVLVGLMERFNESIVLLQGWSDVPLELPYRAQNIAASNDLKKRLLSDERTLARIRECHDQDFKLYEYVQSVIYPRQVAAHGPSLATELADLEAALPAPTILSFRRILGTAQRDLLYKPLTRRAA